MITLEKIKVYIMTRKGIFNLSIVCLILGALCIGGATGSIFEHFLVGLFIGLGIGCFLAALILLRTHKQLLIYNKETI